MLVGEAPSEPRLAAAGVWTF